MLREPEDRSDKVDHPALQWVLGAASILVLLALAIGIVAGIS